MVTINDCCSPYNEEINPSIWIVWISLNEFPKIFRMSSETKKEKKKQQTEVENAWDLLVERKTRQEKFLEDLTQ